VVKRLTQLFAEQSFRGSSPLRASSFGLALVPPLIKIELWLFACPLSSKLQAILRRKRELISAPENMIDKEKVQEFSTNALIKVIEIGPPALAVVSAGIGVAGVILNEPTAQRLGAGLFGEGAVLSGVVILGKSYHEKPREIFREEPPTKP
jgi:hypothetical protein